MSNTVQPIEVGTKWKQTACGVKGERFVRVIEIIGRHTPSSPVNYRILRNDAHPHRVGKTASIRRADLRRKYGAVA